ncbi:MAG: L7Ae/L30e/S12e/Gadd45 family ribosomal protein [Symbiobacteriia bacterium]
MEGCLLESKVAALLGLARRANKVAVGDLAVRAALERGRAALVVIATDAGSSTRDRIDRLCSRAGQQPVAAGTKADLGAAIGQTEKAVLAVTDQHFAKGIRAALGNGVEASEPNISGVD